MKKLRDYYGWLEDREIFTMAELLLITQMHGYNIEALDLAVYGRCGYQTVQQLIDEVELED